MTPIDFKEKNFVFSKPQSMTNDQCSDLPCFKGNTDDGLPCIISCWKLSEEDLKDIQITGCVWLYITGHIMPPVSIATPYPFVYNQ